MSLRIMIKIALVSATLLSVSLACALPIAQRPTQIPQNVVETSAAATLSAILTQAAQPVEKTPAANATATAQAPTLQPTSTVQIEPTATQKPAEPTAVPTSTIVPTSTTVPTATSVPLPCDRAGFVTDVSVPDGTVLPAGTTFTKTWRLKNNGTCTWNTDYLLVFDSGESMTAPASQKIGSSVAPGQTIDISISLKAPNQPGQYRGYWKLRSASGTTFGTGASNQAFYVDIKVIAASAAGNGYDFSANYCLAEWTTSTGKTLSCTEKDGNADGFILYKTKPVLENGYTDDEPSLIMNPPKSNDSVLRGKYPAYTVKEGDFFRSIVGCDYNAKNCNVRFQLDYQIDNGAIQTLGSWIEGYEGNYTSLNVDLSSLIGKNVRFILTVLSNGASDNDRAQWLLPRIEKDPLTDVKP